MSEATILRACLDALAALRILAFRMNTGRVRVEDRWISFGTLGMADVIAFPRGYVLWIECKAEKGKQSQFQKSFEAQVRAHGHRYLIARDARDVINEIAAIEGQQKTTATPQRPPQNEKVISDEQRLQP